MSNQKKIKWSIAQKIAGLTSILIFFIVVSLVSSIFYLYKIQDDLKELEKFDVPLIGIANVIEIHMLEQELAIDELLEVSHNKRTIENENLKKKLKNKFYNHSKKLEEQFSKGIPLSKEAISSTTHSERFTTIYSTMSSLKKESIPLHNILDKILKSLEQYKKPAEETVLLMFNLQEKFIEHSERLIDEIKNLTKHELLLAQKHEKFFFYVEVIIGFSAIFLGILFSAIIIISIKNRLFNISSTIREVNNAIILNLLIPSKKIDLETHDEIGDVATQLTDMIESVSKNIKTREALFKHVQKIAKTDHLTGLQNRHSYINFFEYELSRTTRSGEPLSLIVFDIDDFKKINDTFGHDVGDLVLKELSKIIKDSIRKIDSVFRIGGEEFTIITPYTTSEQAAVLAEQVRKSVEKHKYKKVNEVTISMGISQYDSGDTIETIFKKADDAMYRSKRSGKNRVTIS